MGFFDPVPMKPKPKKRPKIILPKEIPSHRFWILILATGCFWVLVIGGGTALVLWGALANKLVWGWKVTGTVIGIGMGGAFGLFIASVFIGELIRYGAEIGDVKVQWPEESNYDE